MRFDFDLSTAPVVKPVPEGIYLFKVVSSKDLKSKEKQNDMIQWELDIIEPKPVMVDGAPVEKYFHYTTVTPNTLGFLRLFFEACERLKVGPWEPSDLYGATFGAHVVKTVNNQGNEQNNIKKYFRAIETVPQITVQ